MTLANTTLIPEFQHYFYKFIIGSTINRYQIPSPIDIPDFFLQTGSVVELLLTDTFTYPTYKYLYNEASIGSWPVLARQRLMIYPSSKYLEITDSTSGLNFFNLQAVDHVMLNILMQYKHDSTSVILIDTTGITDIEVVIDSTTGIITVTGSPELFSDSTSLTPLSKLIYLYLDFHINQNYWPYYYMPVISTCSMLETAFELKLLDEYFNYLTDNSVDLSIECPETD